MDIVTTILSAAKSVGVSGTLLLAICSHESSGFKFNYAAHDHGSPSYGVCQVKLNSAVQMGFKGNPEDLKNTKTNSLYAAKYLKYEQDRYGDDWVKLASAYNAGSYNESHSVYGCPRNLKYVRLVRNRLPLKFKNRLNCGNTEVVENP